MQGLLKSKIRAFSFQNALDCFSKRNNQAHLKSSILTALAWDLHGFYNLFKFLKVEEKTIKAVLDKTMKKKSFEKKRYARLCKQLQF